TPVTPTRSPRSAKPACEARAEGTMLAVAAGETPVRLAEDASDLKGYEVVTFANGDGHVLAAVGSSWLRVGGADPNGLLWDIPCDDPGATAVFSEREGADFASAAATRDGWGLVFSDVGGLALLDLETKAVTPLTEAPTAPRTCWSGDDALRLRDVPLKLVGEMALHFHRGGPCGFERDWVAEERVLMDPFDPTRRREVETHRVAALATAGDALLLGVGGRCDEPGVVDPAVRGAILRSADLGATWAEVPVMAEGRVMATHAARIVVDRRDPTRLLVLSARCERGGRGAGGVLFRSDDAGATWRALTAPGEDAQAVVAVTALNGQLEQLVVWTAEGEARFGSADGGATWNAMAQAPPPEAGAIEPVTLRGASFLVNDEGVSRTTGPGQRAQRVYPPTP
ncbi:MAG: exo-alpha-sialidase, partial [Myxococcales bacterium]|nr:exo-alpha-sialidase [Myxococcales bacterium]